MHTTREVWHTVWPDVEAERERVGKRERERGGARESREKGRYIEWKIETKRDTNMNTQKT